MRAEAAAASTRVVIAAGGTAGHVKPALATADALRADGARRHRSSGPGRGSGAGLVGGRRHRGGRRPHARARAAPDAQEPGRPRARRARRAPGDAAPATPARREVVIGGGGYVAGPVALAAWLLRIPVLLTEADSHLGMANRLAAPLARRVALAFPIAGRTGPKYVVTGRPWATRCAGRRARRAVPRWASPTMRRCVLVAGGSQGARTINRAVAGAFGDGPPFELIHLAGAAAGGRGPGAARRTATPGPRYHLLGYLRRLPRRGRRRRSGGLPRRWIGVRTRCDRPAGDPGARTRTPRPITRPRTRSGWSTRARRCWCPMPNAPPSASLRSSPSCSPIRRVVTRWRSAARTVARPDAARGDRGDARSELAAA